MIEILEKFKFLAVLAVVISIPISAVFALTAVAFCDVGPFSACVRFAGSVLAIPAAQIASLVVAWIFLKKKRYLRLSAGLMIVSVLPLVLFTLFLVARQMR